MGLATDPAYSQSSQNSGFGVGPVDKGLVVGAIVGVGVAIAAGITVTYFIVHNRGVAVGCIAEVDGRRTLSGDDKKTYALADGGPSLPVGDRLKVKGRKTNSPSMPSLQVERILKDYGRCQP